MKQFLPKLFIIFAVFALFLTSTVPLFAQTATPAQTTSQSSVQQTSTQVPDDTWVQDSDVTFAGKSGARAGQFLDWALQNYDWVCVTRTANGCDNSNNPLTAFWLTIIKIVASFFALIVLVTAFLIIVTRGKSISIQQFIRRFIMMAIFVVLSFAIIQFLYITVDIIQGFFLKNPDAVIAKTHPFISQQNLLYVGFDYSNFIGYRKAGIQYDESAFISVLLVKLTALTYYVMVGILLIRKIILWFFIIISPILPLLLLYAPIRNTGKIWIGEFFRWLLYAPIFAIFLSGLVNIWRSGIPLGFQFPSPTDASQNPYVTAVNIILGGPGQTVGQYNSVNNTDTFALYVVSLLMLWVVIILPFLLLQIFLEYLKSLSLNDTAWLRQIVATGSSFVGGAPKGMPPPLPEGSGSAGLAKQLPFVNKIAIPNTVERGNIANFSMQNLQTSGINAELLKLSNLQVPTIRDIANYEASMLSGSIGKTAHVAEMHESLERIAKPGNLSDASDQSHYSTVRQKLVTEGQKGNPLATSILSAANVVAKGTAPSGEDVSKLRATIMEIVKPSSEKYQSLNKELMQASNSGDQLAKAVVKAGTSGQVDQDLVKRLMDAKEKGNSLSTLILQAANVSIVGAQSISYVPSVNRVQQVSLDDYEAVKKLWSENYQKIDPPKTASGQKQSRAEWLKNEMSKITETTTLLLSSDPQKVSHGMEQVGAILPFLLIGGFSKSEIVAYLKAKFEAAKATLEGIDTKSEEEATMLDREEKKEEKPKEMTAAEEVPLDSENQKKKES